MRWSTDVADAEPSVAVVPRGGGRRRPTGSRRSRRTGDVAVAGRRSPTRTTAAGPSGWWGPAAAGRRRDHRARWHRRDRWRSAPPLVHHRRRLAAWRVVADDRTGLVAWSWTAAAGSTSACSTCDREPPGRRSAHRARRAVIRCAGAAPSHESRSGYTSRRPEPVSTGPRDLARPASNGRPGAPVASAGRRNNQRKDLSRGCRHHEAAAGGRGPLRSPDPPLEPEDAPVHLRASATASTSSTCSRPSSGSTPPTASCAARSQNGGTVLFVGTKKQAQEPIQSAGQRCGMPYVNYRWLGGMLTNFQTVHARVAKLRELERRSTTGETEQMIKKEGLKVKREVVKLDRNLGGIRNLERLPDAVFVIDTKKEHIAVTEANRLGIPVVAVVDTNCDPDVIDYVIPGNDDAIRSAKLMCRVLADAVRRGSGPRARSGARARPATKAETARTEAALAARSERAAPNAGAGPQRGRGAEAARREQRLARGEAQGSERGHGVAVRGPPRHGRRPADGCRARSPRPRGRRDRRGRSVERWLTFGEGRRRAAEADRRRDDGLQAGARGDAAATSRGEGLAAGEGPGRRRRSATGGPRTRARSRSSSTAASARSSRSTARPTSSPRAPTSRSRRRPRDPGRDRHRRGARGAGLRRLHRGRDDHPDGREARRERIELGRVIRYETTDGILDGYKHVQNDRGTIGVLVELGGVDGRDDAAARGRHTTSRSTSRSAAPRYVSKRRCPARRRSRRSASC